MEFDFFIIYIQRPVDQAEITQWCFNNTVTGQHSNELMNLNS